MLTKLEAARRAMATRLDGDVLNLLRRAAKALSEAEAAADAAGVSSTKSVYAHAANAVGATRPDELDALQNAESALAAVRADVCSTCVEQLRGYEVACAAHVFGSVVLAKVLRAADEGQRLILCTPLLQHKDPSVILTDKYASHVLEVIIELAARSATGGSSRGSAPSLCDLLVSFVRRLSGDEAEGEATRGAFALLDALRDRHGTHTMRRLFAALNGREEVAPKAGSKDAGNKDAGKDAGKWAGGKAMAQSRGETEARREVPPEFSQALLGLADALLREEARRAESEKASRRSLIESLFSHACAAPAMQALLTSLPAESPQFDALVRALLHWPEPTEEASQSTPKAHPGKKQQRPAPSVLSAQTVDHIRALCRDSAGSRAVESIVSCAPQWWRPLFLRAFKDDLADMAAHPLANFVVQALLSTAPTPTAVQRVQEQLNPSLASLLASRAGVVLQLAQASARLGCGGSTLLDALALALKLKAPTPGAGQGSKAKGDGGTLALRIMQIGARGGGGDDETSVAVGGIGSRIAQALLSLPAQECSRLLQSFGDLEPTVVLELCRNPMGSRVVESALAAAGGERAAGALQRAVAADAARLARHKSGSFVLQAAFEHGSVEQKTKILEALRSIESGLRASEHGSAMLSKMRFDHFKANQSSWTAQQAKATRTRQTFAALLDSEETPSGRKGQAGAVSAASAARRDAPTRAGAPRGVQKGARADSMRSERNGNGPSHPKQRPPPASQPAYPAPRPYQSPSRDKTHASANAQSSSSKADVSDLAAIFSRTEAKSSRENLAKKRGRAAGGAAGNAEEGRAGKKRRQKNSAGGEDRSAKLMALLKSPPAPSAKAPKRFSMV